MTVANILKTKGREVISIDASEPVTAALHLLVTRRIGAVLVLEAGNQIAGILSERDLVRAMHLRGKDIFESRVADLMTAPVITCSPDDTIAEIMGLMTSHRFRHLPVVDQGNIVGMISIGDVVKSRIEEAEFEVDTLRQYIAL